MNDSPNLSWPLYALAVACIGAIVAAVLLVGPAPASQTTVKRTATVARGVVQSTVSGSGNVQPATQLDLGFKTGGTVTHIYVHQGEQVVTGQLLATLDPESAEVTLQQARASLQSAEASLTSEQESDGEGSSSQSASSGGTKAAAAAASGATASAATSTTSNAPATSTTPTSTAPAATSPTTSTAPATTTPAQTTPSESTSGAATKKEPTSSGTKSSQTSEPSSSGGASSTLSTAAREANISSAEAAVRSAKLTVESDEQAVSETKLLAPSDGTIASLSGQVGEVVTGSGTTRASGSESSSSSSSSSASGLGASTGASSGSSSSPSFAVLTDLSSMRLVVPLSESEVSSVHRGQIAAVTIEALEGKKLAAHVSEVATLSTSNSGVVSYDVTFVLDQLDSGLKPGMSASAEVVVKQASGLNVPTSAISGGSVTVLSAGKSETRRVSTGLVGDSSTIVLSGLKQGETVALPSATTTTSGKGSTTSGARGFGGLSGGGAFPAGGAAPGGGGFLRGGG